MVVDALFGKYKACERTLAKSHLNYCNSNDLILFDRGYPSFDLILHLEKNGIKYLMRSKEKYNIETSKFMKSDLEDKIVYQGEKRLKMRMVKIDLGNGNQELLLTNLYDANIYNKEMLKTLYGKRWGIETNYDILKNILEIEKFSSYSEESILQEIYCTMFLRNCQSILSEELNEEIELMYGQRKYKYKLNTSITMGHLNENIIDIFLENKPQKIIKKLMKIFLRNVVPIRPNRLEAREKDKYRKRKKPKVLKNRKRVI